MQPLIRAREVESRLTFPVNSPLQNLLLLYLVTFGWLLLKEIMYLELSLNILFKVSLKIMKILRSVFTTYYLMLTDL